MADNRLEQSNSAVGTLSRDDSTCSTEPCERPECASVKAWVKDSQRQTVKMRLGDILRPCLSIPLSLLLALAIAISGESIFNGLLG
ncbi:MAG TPA: hypothetical protein V6C72_01305, partial [Chroococcales cyanobacterium]